MISHYLVSVETMIWGFWISSWSGHGSTPWIQVFQPRRRPFRPQNWTEDVLKKMVDLYIYIHIYIYIYIYIYISMIFISIMIWIYMIIYMIIYVYANHFLRFSTSKIYGFPWISHVFLSIFPSFSIPRRASAEFLASPQFQLTLTRRLADPERCEPAPEGEGRAIGGYRGWPLLQQLGIGYRMFIGCL